MSWNYRIVQHLTRGEPAYALHEVYYGEDGIENGHTQAPIEFVGDSPEEVIRSLEMALKDAKERPVYVPFDE